MRVVHSSMCGLIKYARNNSSTSERRFAAPFAVGKEEEPSSARERAKGEGRQNPKVQ